MRRQVNRVYMDEKISTFFEGADIQLPKGDVGLELECEGEDLPSYNGKYWRYTNDGSLRINGVEYIHRKPLPIDEVRHSLELFNSHCVDRGVTMYETDRTSVHTHINVLNLTLPQLISGLVYYYLVENTLIKHAGPQRENNLFCLPMSTSKRQVVNFVQVCKGGTVQNSQKYSALNLAAIGKFGSVEQRSMRGIYDPNFLTEWSDNLLRIFREVPRRFKNPVEVFDYFYGRRYCDYLSVAFDDKFIDKLRSYPGWDERTEINPRLIGKTIYTTNFDTKRKKPVQKKSSSYYSRRTLQHRFYEHAAQVRTFYEMCRQNEPIITEIINAYYVNYHDSWSVVSGLTPIMSYTRRTNISPDTVYRILHDIHLENKNAAKRARMEEERNPQLTNDALNALMVRAMARNPRGDVRVYRQPNPFIDDDATQITDNVVGIDREEEEGYDE